MAGKTKNDALIGIGQLERLAVGYDKTAKTLRKLARGLRKVLAGVEPQHKANNRRAVPQKAKRDPSKRKGMSPAAKKRLSEAMKARWAERRAVKAPELQRRSNGEGNRKTASPNAA